VTACDFGMSTFLPEGKSQGQFRGTNLPIKWCAPEVLTHKIYSEKTDSYAFGMFIYEVIDRCEPFEGMSVNDVGKAVATGQRLRPTIPPHCPKEWSDIMIRCWQQLPENRPTMDDLNAFFVEYLDRVEACKSDTNRIQHVYLPLEPLKASEIEANGRPTARAAQMDERYFELKLQQYQNVANKPSIYTGQYVVFEAPTATTRVSVMPDELPPSPVSTSRPAHLSAAGKSTHPSSKVQLPTGYASHHADDLTFASLE